MTLLSAIAVASISHGGTAEGKALLILHGAFLEGCSCAGTCTFESAGRQTGCQALGAYRVDKGRFGGRDISDSKFAFVAAKDGSLHIYVEAPKGRRQAVVSLAKTLFREGFGKLAGVEDARIVVGRGMRGGKPDRYFTVNGGKTAELHVEPLFGGDGKTPVELRNVFGDPYDNLFQGTARLGSFKGEPSFELKNTSGFYQTRLTLRKKV